MGISQSGLKIGVLRGTLATSTLAAATTVLGTGDMDAEMDAPFLCKSVDIHVSYQSSTDTQAILCGLAQGDASTGEISVALTQEFTDPFDVGEASLVAKNLIIFWETLEIMGVDRRLVSKHAVRLGGGKGIPIAEGKGLNFFVFNPGGGALVDHNVTFQYVLKGVWLGD